jgi:hypothetical protein
MKKEQILSFCSKWLPAWKGNKPNDLIEFYSDNTLYIDPANKQGLRGRSQILPYFRRLLAANPNWNWEPVGVLATDLGFVAKWKATIPIGTQLITEYRMDIVEIERGRIARNEVYFDRSIILEALRGRKSKGH